MLFGRVLVVVALVGASLVPALPASPAPRAPRFGPAIDDSSYQGQSRCAPGAKPGVLAFRALVLAEYPATGAGSISRGCNIGGQSEHKEGRAWDWGVNASDASDRAAVDDLLDWLLAEDRNGNDYAMARRLGIMYLIWNKRFWSPWNGWDVYCRMKNGTCVEPGTKDARHPHTDHVHFSFTWAGARKKTNFWNPSRSMIASLAPSPDGKGYWMAGRNGSMFPSGSAGFYGSKADRYLAKPVVDAAASPSGAGYWMVTRVGRVLAFGDASHRGRAKTKNRVAGIAATPTGRGYWIATRSGRVFALGDAKRRGGVAGSGAKIADIAATPTGRGYWLFATGGKVFAFGDAGFFGGASDTDDTKRTIVAGDNKAGDGYWTVTEKGRVFPFGSARSYGGAPGKLGAPVVSLTATPSGEGYWIATARGRVFAFGDARVLR